MIIIFVSCSLWVLLLVNSFAFYVHAAFYIMGTFTKSIALIFHKEAVLSISSEEVNLATCGFHSQCSVWQWLRSHLPLRQDRQHPTWPWILTDSISLAYAVFWELGAYRSLSSESHHGWTDRRKTESNMRKTQGCDDTYWLREHSGVDYSSITTNEHLATIYLEIKEIN